MKKTALMGLMAVLVMVVGTAPPASAYTVTDLNSVFSVGATGANTWSVDGIDQLTNQSFWWRIGATGGQGLLSSLDASESEGGHNINLTYTNPNVFRAEVQYSLFGGASGSHQSDVSEVIRLTNLMPTGGNLDLHFFQYSDFDLNGTPGNDNLRFSADHQVVTQWESGAFLSETVHTPPAGHYEGSIWPSLWSNLNSGSPYTLSDSPLAGNVISGDCEWGYEWDLNIAPGSTFIISKDKGIRSDVPEPGSLLLFGTAMVGMGLAWRRRKRS